MESATIAVKYSKLNFCITRIIKITVGVSVWLLHNAAFHCYLTRNASDAPANACHTRHRVPWATRYAHLSRVKNDWTGMEAVGVASDRPLHRSPRSAMLSDWLYETMTWSITRTSISASVVFRVCVSTSSARDGCTAPLGWLCDSTTAEA